MRLFLAMTAGRNVLYAAAAGVLLFCGAALSAKSQPREVPPARIMPLGDSITQGEYGRFSYRVWLGRLLTERGCRFDFVGSQREMYRGATPGDYDPDHEGHWGWTTDEVLRRLDGWAAAARPDVVLLHLGTNDVGRQNGVEQAAANLERIIVLLRASNPAVVVLLAQLIPGRGLEDKIRALNARIAELAGRLNSSSSPVLVVDQFSGFDAAADTYDGLHPTAAGERKLAQRWFAVLKDLPFCKTALGGGNEG